MKALLDIGRRDIIKAAALVAIVAFPLMAHAQFGRGSGPLKTSQDVPPVAAAMNVAVARADSCADQHWPFFSAGCLRRSTKTVESRLISMNVEPSANSAAGVARAVRTADTVRDNGLSAGSKKTVKPRIASHRRERRMPNASYAANVDAQMPSW